MVSLLAVTKWGSEIEPDIPQNLAAPASAALAWINESQDQNYELTGLVDYDDALAANAGDGYEMGLILCDGEICAREEIRVQPVAEGYEFSLAETPKREIPSLLDPPEGVRKNWLDSVLVKHEFVVLLFYRGLW